MPLINGLKMACEPCIRGHRSTKCNHADERLMVPVRKPGRPLSSCPHPSSRPCACTAVTAAIPRKQKCGCGTSAPTAAAVAPEENVIGVVATQPSPSKPASSAFRVQKPAPRSAPGRKQSLDPAGLERMHSSQLNILPIYDGTPQHPTSAHNGHMDKAMPSVAPYEAMGPATHTQTVDHPKTAAISTLRHPAPLAAAASPASNAITNGHCSDAVVGCSATSTPVKNPSSCCSKGAVPSSLSQAGDRKATAALSNPGELTHGGSRRSCCASSVAKSPDTEAKPQVNLVSTMEDPSMTNGVFMQPFQAAPQPMPDGMYPYFPHPTIFAYPPQYGSYLQPLQPEQWRHVMSMMGPGHAAPSTNAFASQSTLPMQQPIMPGASPSWTSHQCTCGDSCQCIGCAAHPYNDATQDYVRSAWNTMSEDAPTVPDGTNDDNVRRNGNRDAHAGRPSERTKAPVTNRTEDTTSTTAPQTPSDKASSVSEEQTLSASDFFFVSYPFGDSCAGEMASCPCGDDCQCIGCAIHNNPGPSPVL